MRRLHTQIEGGVVMVEVEVDMSLLLLWNVICDRYRDL